MKRRMMLYFGSFNPIHRGHIALAEWVVEQDLCDEMALIVSPQSPYKPNSELAPELDRFELAEIACRASAYPERIRPSVIEFLLPKPSYTIDTLHHLAENYGDQCDFSILMGADQLARLDGWKSWEQILDYRIYVYPRRGSEIPPELTSRVTLLNDAPLFDISATEVRRRLAAGEPAGELLHPEVEACIRRKNLWPATAPSESAPSEVPAAIERLLEQGREHYKKNAWGEALNDFNRVLQLDAGHTEAQQYAEMIREILAFRYTDIYNP